MQTDLQQTVKNTLVLGLGASGLSCLDYFAANDYAAEVFAYDDRFADDRFNNKDADISKLEELYPKVNFVAEISCM